MNVDRKTSMTAEQHPGSTSPAPTPPWSVIDPSNGDNGCYSHTWEDQTVRKEPLASAVHAPDWAASIHYAFLAGGRRIKAYFSVKVKRRGKKTKKELSPGTDWKYARLESTAAVLPDSGCEAQTGSFRKGMVPPSTDRSESGFRLWERKQLPELFPSESLS